MLWDAAARSADHGFQPEHDLRCPQDRVTGYDGWIPQELRPGNLHGTVGPRDDIWAAGRLIFFVRNQGENLVDRGQLGRGLDAMFNGMFDRVFGPPESRPTARELLEDGLRRRSPCAERGRRQRRLKAGREIS